MGKQLQRPFPILYPVPVVLVTCIDDNGEPNVSTMAWVGTVASVPPQVAVAIRRYRYSHDAIKGSGEFVINVPNRDQLYAVDYCGEVSKTQQDKFARIGLTPEPATKVQAPLIQECPVNLECKVSQIVPLGSHDLFIGEIVAIHVEETILDEEGFIDFEKAKPIAYLGNEYWSLGERLERAAFTLGDISDD